MERVLLIRQYRHSVGRLSVGAGRGAHGPRANPRQAQRDGNWSRKLATRRGTGANCSTYFPSPGLRERMDVDLCWRTASRRAQRSRKKMRSIDAETLSLAASRTHDSQRGPLRDAKSIAGLLVLHAFRGGAKALVASRVLFGAQLFHSRRKRALRHSSQRNIFRRATRSSLATHRACSIGFARKSFPQKIRRERRT